MYVTIVHVNVKPQYIEQFIAESTKNHLASVQEDGNMRFDCLQQASDPEQFILYEAYQSEQHAGAHKQTAHYLAWREAVAHMMAKPREGVVYNGLLPES